MVDVVNKIITEKDEKYKSVGVFPDLQKAYDCIDHRL